jgi:hypothetical protein
VSLSIIAIACASVHRFSSSDCVGTGSIASASATCGGARRATHEGTWSLLRSGALLRYERPKEGARIVMALDAQVFALCLTVVSLFLSLVL